MEEGVISILRFKHPSIKEVEVNQSPPSGQLGRTNQGASPIWFDGEANQDILKLRMISRL